MIKYRCVVGLFHEECIELVGALDKVIEEHEYHHLRTPLLEKLRHRIFISHRDRLGQNNE